MLEPLTSALEAVQTLIARTPAAVLIIVGVPMLVFGADWLVAGSVSMARRLGISTLIIGLTIVAAGTSAPELTVNVIAAASGNPGISFGNVIGSNIANIGLVLSIGALIAPLLVHVRVVRQDMPWLMGISIGMCGVAFLPMVRTKLQGGEGSELFGYGFVEGILMMMAFLCVTYLWYRNAKTDAAGAELLAKEAEEFAQSQKQFTLPRAAGLFIIGLVALIIGGQLTKDGAVRIAAYFGLSEAIIGMTIVAVATSLPELFTTIVACRKGHADLAVGNVVGSNIFNILLVLGMTALIADVPLPEGAGWQDLAAMLAMTGLLWWFAVTHRRHVTRGEGALLLTLYVGYVAWGVLRETTF